jgi:hypothetical protein
MVVSFPPNPSLHPRVSDFFWRAQAEGKNWVRNVPTRCSVRTLSHHAPFRIGRLGPPRTPRFSARTRLPRFSSALGSPTASFRRPRAPGDLVPQVAVGAPPDDHRVRVQHRTRRRVRVPGDPLPYVIN